MNKIKYALIGCGRISNKHLEAVRSADMEVVALCDVNIEKANRQKEKFELHNTKIYSDYLEMIESEPIDVVAVATDSGSHAQIAIGCINHGINVLIEKPIALSMFDAKAIESLAAEKQVVVGVCHQNRLNPAVAFIKKTIVDKQNNIGRILSISATIRWNRNRAYYDEAKWRGTWQHDGGALMNQCIHNIDLVNYFIADEPEEVFAYIANQMHGYNEVEDYGTAVLKFTNGCHASIEGTVNTFPKNYEETLFIITENGTFSIGGVALNKVIYQNYSGISQSIDTDVYSTEVDSVYGNGHIGLYRNFCDAIRNGAELVCSVKDGIKALELVLGIYKSALEHKAIKFPIGNFSTNNMIKWKNN